MRNREFRVWDKLENKMNYDGCIGSGSSCEFINIDFKGNMYLQNAYGLDIFSKNPTFDAKEDRFILSDYTGMSTPEGVKVFEGDLLVMEKHSDGKPRAVEFQNGCYYVGNFGTLDSAIPYAKVIGNIFENEY